MALSKLALAPPGVFNPNGPEVSAALQDVYTHFESSITPTTVLSTNIADYIFLPLSHLLKHPKLGDTQTTYLLRILTLLIRHCWSGPNTMPYVMAKQLFPLLTFLTGGAPNPKDNTEINAKSEELKQAGSAALEAIFTSLSVQKSAKLYDFFSNVENLPALGHGVTILLEFALNGKSIELQLQALEALRTLYVDVIHDGEIISYILPGNVSVLTKVISITGSKTHYTVIVKALSLLRTILKIVYNDEELEVNIKEVEAIEEIIEDPELTQITITEEGFKKVHRTNAWLKATSSQVKLALANIKKIYSHSKFEVRQELANLASMIVSHCVLSLNSSVSVAVDILAHLSNDDSVIVPREIFEPKVPQQKEILDKIITTELDTYVNTFNSVIQSPNEEKILSSISAIKFAAARSPNSFLLDKLTKSCVIELSDSLRRSQKKPKVISTSNDMTELILIAEDSSKLQVDNHKLAVFDTVMTPQVQLALSDLFQSLAQIKDPTQVINELLSMESQSLNERSIILWIVNNFMQGYVSKVAPHILSADFLTFGDDDDDDELVLLQKPEFVYSILDYSKSLLDELSEMDPTEAVVQANSIALDTIAVVQQLLKEEFRPELIDYLYPVVDSLASPSETVRQHALNTSLVIADELYGGSLESMIMENADYLIDAISVRLSNAMTTRSTAILAVCTKIAGFEIIDTFKDLMEILFSLIDNYHGYEDICIGFFLLFEIISDEIRKQYMSDYGMEKIESFESSSTYAPWGLKNIRQLVALLDKRNRDISELAATPLEDDVEDEINKPDSDDEDDVSGEIPDVHKEWTSLVPQDAYKLLQQITYYGERLLTHPSIKLRLQILRTYNKIIPILATAPDNLLPIVASIWAVVASMVTSPDPKIVLPASEVLEKMILYSGNFVMKRFLDMWVNLQKSPILVNAVRQSAHQQKVVLPGIEMKCYNSVVAMLVTALNTMGRSISDITTEHIIRSCIGVVPTEKFEQHADMAWCLKREVYGAESAPSCAKSHPKMFEIDGEPYHLV